MPASRKPAPKRPSRPRAAVQSTARHALLVIDDRPWKNAAWTELQAARKRQEQAARDLHRHEEVDRPAYDEWLHRTFPTFVTRLRELHEQVFAKGQKVQMVQAMAEYTGRSARKIWREQQEREANPELFEREESTAGNPFRDEEFGSEDDFFQDENDFGAESDRAWEQTFEPRRAAARSRPNATARDVYRRLVQRLHPDRGGEWTATRQRLWHEVQQAWAAGDADWLARLEVEWDAAHDVLTAGSPLSRLLAAIQELHAARRDVEHKLRRYRDSPAWRFTLAVKKRAQLHRRTEMNFRHDIVFLERQLAYLNALVASWEEPSRSRRRHRSRDVEIRFCE